MYHSSPCRVYNICALLARKGGGDGNDDDGAIDRWKYLVKIQFGNLGILTRRIQRDR